MLLVPNKQRFPNGLCPLSEYAHENGLLFIDFRIKNGTTA
jgi:hypothetical protein